MRIIYSFFLSLFVYSLILGFFFYMILYKKSDNKTQVVYIHKAIIKDNIIPKKKQKPQLKQKIIKKTKINKSTQIKTKDTFSNGGEDVKFDDLFSNVNDNIPTEKIKIKKKEEMTKKIGKSIAEETKKHLSKIQKSKKIEVNINNINGSKKNADYLQTQFYKQWISMDIYEPDKEVDIQVNIINGKMDLYVIATNLDTIRLNIFLNKLRNVDISKIKENFNAKFIFKSKLKE